MNRKEPSLIFCILMDVIGYATYAIPFLGEFGDILWAPVSSIIFFLTFGGWKGAMGGMFNFVEEILPGTDFIPSFTHDVFLSAKREEVDANPDKNILALFVALRCVNHDVPVKQRIQKQLIGTIPGTPEIRVICKKDDPSPSFTAHQYSR